MPSEPPTNMRLLLYSHKCLYKWLLNSLGYYKSASECTFWVHSITSTHYHLWVRQNETWDFYPDCGVDHWAQCKDSSTHRCCLIQETQRDISLYAMSLKWASVPTRSALVLETAIATEVNHDRYSFHSQMEDVKMQLYALMHWPLICQWSLQAEITGDFAFIKKCKPKWKQGPWWPIRLQLLFSKAGGLIPFRNYYKILLHEPRLFHFNVQICALLCILH